MIEEPPPPQISERAVLSMGFLGEAFLGILALTCISLWDLEVAMPLHPASLLYGALFTLPILLIGIVLLEKRAITSRIPEYEFFRDEIVVPLCVALSPGGALLIALASGLCEELLFRGALYSALKANFGVVTAAALSSFLFAVVHFIGVIWRFRYLVVLYTLAGLYLWFVAHYCGDVLAPITTHALYNYCVIRFVQKKYGASG